MDPTHMIGDTVDTAERKQNQMAQYFAYRVFQSSPDPMCVMGTNFRCLQANDTLASYHTVGASQLIGVHVQDMLGRDVFEEFIQPRFDECLRGHDIAFESWVTYPTLRRRYMSAKCWPLRLMSGYVGTVVMMLRDMTESKLAKEALEVSEQHLRRALQAARVGTWEWDITTDRKTWSDGAEALFGQATGSFAGTHDAFLRLVHAEDLDLVNQAIDRAIRNQEPYQVEFRIVWHDGTTHWLASQGEVLRDTNGAPLRMAGTLRDITRRRAMEHALWTSEQKLRRNEAYLADGQRLSHTGSWAWNVASGELFWSSEQFRILGLDPEKAKPSKSMFEMVHPEDRVYVEQSFATAVREGSLYENDYRIVRPDGTIRYVHSVAQPVFNESGDLTEYVGTMIDSTERKHAERLLREANEKVEMILDSITDRFFAFDKEWRLTYFNKQAQEQLRALGKNPASLIGKVLWEEFPHPPVEDTFRRAMCDRVAITHEHYYPPLGEWVENRIFPSQDGGLAIFQRYVTERKRADGELRRSEAYLAEGQRLSHTGSWAWNVSTGELFWSREHFHICGVDPDKVKPSYPMALQWIHSEDRALAQQTFERAIGERSDFEQECRIVRPDGTIRHIRSLAHPVFSDSGDLTEYVGTIIDITERREAELQLSQLSGRLLQVQDEERRSLARELHDSTAQALTALSLRLAVLEGDALMFSREAKHALADSHDLLGQVSREIRSLSYLLHPPFLDELGLGSAVLWYLDGFFQRSGIKVQAQLPTAMPRLSTDTETTLFRIIQECLTNILKHSGSPAAALRIVLTEKEVMLEVKDQGKGFPTALLDSSNNVVFGVGVGIMGMRERVRQLHGRLDIDSGEWGTSVTATLPVSSVAIGVE